jgi:hypothetical protein
MSRIFRQKSLRSKLAGFSTFRISMVDRFCACRHGGDNLALLGSHRMAATVSLHNCPSHLLFAKVDRCAA